MSFPPATFQPAPPSWPSSWPPGPSPSRPACPRGAWPRPPVHLYVELLELLQVEDAAGTVLQKALVPLLQLLLAELGALNQVLQHLWGQLAVGFPHGRAWGTGGFLTLVQSQALTWALVPQVPLGQGSQVSPQQPSPVTNPTFLQPESLLPQQAGSPILSTNLIKTHSPPTAGLDPPPPHCFLCTGAPTSPHTHIQGCLFLPLHSM